MSKLVISCDFMFIPLKRFIVRSWSSHQILPHFSAGRTQQKSNCKRGPALRDITWDPNWWSGWDGLWHWLYRGLPGEWWWIGNMSPEVDSLPILIQTSIDTVGLGPVCRSSDTDKQHRDDSRMQQSFLIWVNRGRPLHATGRNSSMSLQDSSTGFARN